MIRGFVDLTAIRNKFAAEQEQGIPSPTPANPVVVENDAVFNANVTLPNGLLEADIATNFLRLGEGGVTLKGVYTKSQFGNEYLQLKTAGPDYYVQVYNQPQPNPTPVPTQNATPTPAATQNPTPTPAHTPYPSGTPAATPIPTQTQGPTSTPFPTRTPTASRTPSPTVTSSRTPTPSVTPSRTPTLTPTPSSTPNATPRPTNIPPTSTPTPTSTLNRAKLLQATYSQSSVYPDCQAATFAGMTNNNFNETTQTGTYVVGGQFSWIRADLGGIQQVKTIILGYPTSNLLGGWNTSYLTDRRIQISPDGVVWTTIVESIPSPPPQNFSGYYTYTANNTVSCRYIQVITKFASQYVALTEFQIFKA